MARKHTDPERELIKNNIADLYIRGYSFRDMAKWVHENLGLSCAVQTCYTHCKAILSDWHKERVDKIDKLITLELIGLNKVEKEAWDGWERSKQDRKKSVERFRQSKNKKGENLGTSREKTDEIIQGNGDVRFLEIIKDCKLQRLAYLTKGTFGESNETTVNNTQNNVTLVVTTPLSPKMEKVRAENAQIVPNSEQ